MEALRVLAVFLGLGLRSFGGPIAHLGYFREAFVERRKWISESDYADLVALCQFLPGPASSQVGFALGLRRAGLPGAIAAFVGFTAPSALLMFAVAQGLGWFSTPGGAAVAHGLKLIAVAVVAHAVYGMAKSLCPDRLTAGLGIAAAAAVLVGATAWISPLAIAVAGLAGVLAPQKTVGAGAASESPAGGWRLAGAAAAFALFLALLFGAPLAAREGAPALEVADAFYRAGALVFGGGHVVLPLLESGTVGQGWLSADQFLAGYGAAQAMPGPLFTFAAFLGAASGPPGGGWQGALVATLAVFLPGFLLVLAGLPLWARIKAAPRARGFVRGANAAVVGVLAAALYDPVFVSAVAGPRDLVVAAFGFVLLQAFKAPAWAVVILVGALGAGVALGAGAGLA